MKDRRLEEKPACSVVSAPVPSEIICPRCKAEIEVWSDETEATCTSCGVPVNDRG